MGYNSTNPFVRLTDPSGASILERRNGVMQRSDNDGATFGPVGEIVSFADETLALARKFMPGLGLNRVMGTDFDPIWEASLSAANTPVIETSNVGTGGVLSFSGAGASSVALNPVTPGAATFNPILGQFACRCTPWMIRGRFFINAAAFTAGTSIVLLSLDGTGAAGGNAAHKMQILSNANAITHAQQTYVQLANGGGFNTVSTGPDGLLGGTNSQLPINSWFNACLFFDQVNVRWAFGDQFNGANKLDATALVGQMDFMPDNAGCVTVSSNDTTVGANFKIDALAIAYRADRENK